MRMFTIQPFGMAHKTWAEGFMIQNWGSVQMVSRGKLYQVLDFPGFIAIVDDKPQGIIIYNIVDDQCEVLLLDSAVEGLGVGSALVDHVKQAAQKAGCSRLWLITTNDNTHAIRWYQKRGFTLAAVHINALAESRRLKPEIPPIGFDGIPLRDEIEFEMPLT